MTLATRISYLEGRNPAPSTLKVYRLSTEESFADDQQALMSQGVDPDGELVMWIMLVPGAWKVKELDDG